MSWKVKATGVVLTTPLTECCLVYKNIYSSPKYAEIIFLNNTFLNQQLFVICLGQHAFRSVYTTHWRIFVFTEERVLSPPKAGQCPLMGNSSEPRLECQFDGACPREQKCCHRQTDREFSRTSGYCTTPIQVNETRPKMCPNASIIVRVALTWFGFC